MRRFFIVMLALFASTVAVLWLAGGRLTEPAQRVIGPPPVGLPVTAIAFSSASGAMIKGWLVAGQKGKGVILLLHGVRDDRRSMWHRAVFLQALGYHVLMMDFQAHGESVGRAISFGAREALDVQAALDYLAAQLPGEPIGVIGASLGGAALVLAEPKGRVRAVVLEAVYPTIEEAVADRLTRYLGAPGAWLAPLLLWQLEPRLGVKPEMLRPIEHIVALQAPVLLLNGTLDQNTTPAEAQRLYAAAAEPKTLWLVPGAAHVDLYRAAPDEYRARITAFFARYMTPAP